MSILKPLKARIEATDGLIDEIVYRLYPFDMPILSSVFSMNCGIHIYRPFTNILGDLYTHPAEFLHTPCSFEGYDPGEKRLQTCLRAGTHRQKSLAWTASGSWVTSHRTIVSYVQIKYAWGSPFFESFRYLHFHLFHEFASCICP
jgi:hypothetical protein